MDIQPELINSNHIQLQVYQAGPEDGELVILLHGFPEHALAWRSQIEYLAAQGYRVLAPNQRGYGDSNKPKGYKHYDLDTLAQDIVGLIDAAGRDTAHVIGHDWGAAVTWWLGCNYPERLQQIVVLNVPHHTAFLKFIRRQPSQLLKSWYMFFFQLPWLPEKLLTAGNYAFLRNNMVKSANADTFSQEDIEQYITQWSKPGALTAMINWYRSSIRRPPQARLHKVPVPVSIIWGRQDQFLDERLAELSMNYCEKLKGLHYIDKAGHWLAHEASEPVNQLLLNCLKHS